MFVFLRYGDNCVCFACNGIAQIAAVYFTQVHIILLESLTQETVQYLIGITEPQMDISTGVSAFQSFHLHLAAEVSGRYVYLFICKLCNGVDTSCAADKEFSFIFLTDPIETVVEGEWLKAKGTTLGADNGIGVATELAILADDSIQHGPLECLFTVDEETGLTGAFALKEGFMNGDIL